MNTGKGGSHIAGKFQDLSESLHLSTAARFPSSTNLGRENHKMPGRDG